MNNNFQTIEQIEHAESNGNMYGAWITPQGDLIPVPTYSHDEVAVFLLCERFGMDEKIVLDKMSSSNFSLYNHMFRLGYIRVLFTAKGNHTADYWNKLKPNKAQKEYIKRAVYTEKVELYYH